MRTVQYSLFFTFLFLEITSALYKNIKQREIVGDPGRPLFLTPLIQNNQIQEAKEASRVNFTSFNSTVSYSGYLTTDESYNSSLFFWYFPSENDFDDAPLLLWLQGGPGAPSLFGLFIENGPFVVNEQGKVVPRQYSWTKQHSVVYIDSPVGTGYSTTNEGYVTNQTKVGADLHNALIQFLTLFPELQNKPFFITGESYAGKYIPALAHTIYVSNPQATLKINLQGFLIGDGLTDPIHQCEYAEYLYQLGLIDSNGRDEIRDLQETYKSLIGQEHYSNATDTSNNILTSFSTRFGFTNLYNYLYPNDPHDAASDMFEEFIQRADVRKAIHVGDTPFGDGNVYSGLYADISKSVAPWVSELLSYYRGLIYTGQTDIIVAYPLTLNYLQNLNFSSATEYKTATRNLWYVGDELAGYVKQAGNLTEVLVRNSGHMVPADQPKWAYDLVYRFVRSLEYEGQPRSQEYVIQHVHNLKTSGDI